MSGSCAYCGRAATEHHHRIRDLEGENARTIQINVELEKQLSEARQDVERLKADWKGATEAALRVNNSHWRAEVDKLRQQVGEANMLLGYVPSDPQKFRAWLHRVTELRMKLKAQEEGTGT